MFRMDKESFQFLSDNVTLYRKIPYLDRACRRLSVYLELLYGPYVRPVYVWLVRTGLKSGVKGCIMSDLVG